MPALKRPESNDKVLVETNHCPSCGRQPNKLNSDGIPCCGGCNNMNCDDESIEKYLDSAEYCSTHRCSCKYPLAVNLYTLLPTCCNPDCNHRNKIDRKTVDEALGNLASVKPEAKAHDEDRVDPVIGEDNTLLGFEPDLSDVKYYRSPDFPDYV